MSAISKPTRAAAAISAPGAAILISVLLFICGGMIRPGFADYNQVLNILRLASFLGIVAAGQTVVIIGGNEGIDLSVGAVVTMSAVIIHGFVNGSDSMVLPMLALALLCGAVVGTINGFAISKLRIPPLVMTLGMTGVINGLILGTTGGHPEGNVAPVMKSFVSDPWFFGIPGVVFLWVLLGGGLWLLLRRTVYGKRLYAIGGSDRVARFSGVPVERMVVLTYALSGLLAAFGGFVILGYTSSVFLTLGDSYTLPSIAAVVVGGTLISGGVGGYAGTMAGAVLLTIVQSLLITLGLPEFGRQIVYGLILLVLISAYGRSRPALG